MANRRNRSEYATRMHRVLEHIDQQLDSDLRLTDLARIAHFSDFHFHRIFVAWTGETLGAYLRRRRVEMAAIRLAGQPKSSVLDIAVGVGFGSAEAFARAFKARFGCSPTQWRTFAAQKRNPDQAHSNRGQVPRQATAKNARSRTDLLGAAMKVKVIERKPVKIAYLRHTGPYGEPLSAFWQNTVHPWLAANNQLGQPRYGISLDDPMVTEGSQCRYDAGVEVRGKILVPGDSQTTTVAGGQYAVTAFRGTVDQIGDVWNSMLREWLPTSGMQLDARPFFEYYAPDGSFDPKTGVFTCDIAIPVASL
jgi:AraC family transcriptional regulator